MFHRKSEEEKRQEFLRNWKATREKGRMHYALKYIRDNFVWGYLGMIGGDFTHYLFAHSMRRDFHILYITWFICTLFFGFLTYRNQWPKNEEKFLRLKFYDEESDD